MKKHAKLIITAVGAALFLLLTGCFAKTPEGLYALPQLSDEYIRLQSVLDSIQSAGAEYSAPTSGSNRQAVQLEDIDGDGEKEAIAFFKVESDEKPLKIYILRNHNGEYSEAAVLEGEGMNIESVAYVDLDGDGVMEMIAGRQISAGVKLLMVYSLKNFEAAALVSADYTKYSLFDATGDGMTDLMLLRVSSSELSGEAELYTVSSEGELTSASARMSLGVESVLQTRVGKLTGGDSALFVESVINGSSIVTDIFAYRQSGLLNITADEMIGISEQTLRSNIGVNCRDIDGDGVMEVPCPVQLPSRSSTVVYWATEWYAYRPNGDRVLDMTTFHNTTDGWYFTLPEHWNGRITVRREDTVSGERAIVFSGLSAGVTVTDLLEIYTLTGNGRDARATKGERFVLYTADETIYAARILAGADALGVTEEYVKENFNIIYSEWITE